MHFAFYIGDRGRIGLNMHFKVDVKSGLSVDLSVSDTNLELKANIL